jgi:putative nucleotidyltransferase-like protein
MALYPSRVLDRVGALLDSAPRTADLEYHRLELVAAARMRREGRAVPAELVARERAAAVAALAAPALLRRVRMATTGPLVLIKGPDVARYYPDPAERDFSDLDVLAPDAVATQRRLLQVGFEEVGEPRLYEDIHHLRPLHWPGLPLVIEVHSAPKWIEGVEPPDTAELIAAAESQPPRPDGMLVLPAAHHALVLAAHGWAHEPLARLRDLLDIALVAGAADLDEVDRLAKRWGVWRMWRTTSRAIDAVVGDGPRPLSVALWGRHLVSARERTVLESHLERWCGDIWGIPRNQLLAALTAIGADMRPRSDEGWTTKVARSRAAISNAFVPKSQHDQMLERKETYDAASPSEAATRVA